MPVRWRSLEQVRHAVAGCSRTGWGGVMMRSWGKAQALIATSSRVRSWMPDGVYRVSDWACSMRS